MICTSAPRVFAGGPIGPDLLVNLKMLAPQPGQCLAKTPQEPLMLGAALLWNHVTVGLQ